MSFGIYIHIPYCIQRCSYCDFATYEQSQILPKSDYVQILLREMEQKKYFFNPQPLTSLYFGGGTPSLLPIEQIQVIFDSIKKLGFIFTSSTEVTLEINPATVDKNKMKAYLDLGINRFSVGAQTFNESALKQLGREHSVEQTIATLGLLQEFKVNYNFDLLFAYPQQTLQDLQKDLDWVLKLRPNHVSPYCLTVPESHPLTPGRPMDEIQVQMFADIESTLTKNGYARYEISNYAQPGFESRHNLLYWEMQPVWGLGLSAHSYSTEGKHGIRFWNLKNIHSYQQQVESYPQESFLDLQSWPQPSQKEILQQHEALTDFCHTSLRLSKGLLKQNLVRNYGPILADKVELILNRLVGKGWLEPISTGWRLTRQGVLLSNLVFAELTFLENDLEQY